VTRTCDSCGEPFLTTRSTARWCSARCSKRGQRGAVNPLTSLSVEVSAAVAAGLAELAEARALTVPALLLELVEAASAGRLVELVDMRTDDHRGWVVIEP